MALPALNLIKCGNGFAYYVLWQVHKEKQQEKKKKQCFPPRRYRPFFYYQTCLRFFSLE